MSLFTPKDAASILTAHDEIHGLADDQHDAWPSVTQVVDLPVVEIELVPVEATEFGTRPARKAAEHFHAVVLPGAHNSGRFVIDLGWMTCDPCSTDIVRLDSGTSLDEVLIAVAGHECGQAADGVEAGEVR